MSNAGYGLEIWERIHRRTEPRIKRLVETIHDRISTDESLIRFRDLRPVPWQFFEVLTRRASDWVSEVYGICLSEWTAASERETQDFRRAIWAFEIDPFIQSQLPDLLLRAAGFKTLERQLAIRGELKGYMPERHPILTPIVSCCWKVKENVRSQWKQRFVPGESSAVPGDSSPTASGTKHTSPTKRRGRPSDKLTEYRRRTIQRVAATGVTEETYCRALDDAGLGTPIPWQKNEDCPKKYVEAWNHSDLTMRSKWRRRISDEKYNYTLRKPHA